MKDSYNLFDYQLQKEMDNEQSKGYVLMAMEQKQKNFKETGIYETNIQRERREK